jgi:hypothetical protein
MDTFCAALMGGGITLFLGLFLLGWMDEREDKYAGIGGIGAIPKVENYRSYEQERRAANLARHALDITIETITKGDIQLRVNKPRAILKAEKEWKDLIESVRKEELRSNSKAN